MSKELILYGKNSFGKVAIVDNDDYEWLSRYRWHADVRNYVYTFVKGQRIYIHRLVTNANANELVDHKNHDKLDNRKSNLRKCTNSQNQANTKSWMGRETKGVYFFQNRWVARIMINGKRFFIGRFKSKDDAIESYKTKAKEVFGEFVYSESENG